MQLYKEMVRVYYSCFLPFFLFCFNFCGILQIMGQEEETGAENVLEQMKYLF